MKQLTVKIDVTEDVARLIVTGFEDIIAFNITLTYDPAAVELTPPEMLTNGGGTIANGHEVPGILKFGWFTFPAVDLPDGTELMAIKIKRLSDADSVIGWQEDAGFFLSDYETHPPTTYIPGQVTTAKELPIFPKKAKVAEKKKLLGYKGTQAKKAVKKCTTCKRCTVKRCKAGFVVAANGICNYHIK